MAKFTYSMQSILDVKYKLEDQAKTAFMQAQVKVDEAQNELVMIRERKVQYDIAAEKDIADGTAGCQTLE